MLKTVLMKKLQVSGINFTVLTKLIQEISKPSKGLKQILHSMMNKLENLGRKPIKSTKICRNWKKVDRENNKKPKPKLIKLKELRN